jgi:predicted ATPase
MSATDPLDQQTTFLLSLERKTDRAQAPDAFPFSVPAVRTLSGLDLSARVNFFVGSNGSGKSTLLEGIAQLARLPTVGSSDVSRDDTLTKQRALTGALRLTWSRRTHRGFFLRAEDFFGFTKRIASLRSELSEDLGRTEVGYQGRSAYAKGLAQLPLRSSIAELERTYGVDPDAQSHGESFLSLFQSRFVPGGLYLLDEPEAALSPQSQLAFLVLLGQMTRQNAQFIIATHSPIVAAFPGARIYSFDSVPVSAVAYDDLEHVTLTRSFLNNPELFLRHLF